VIPYRFHAEARAEFDDAVRYYQAKSPEVRERFVAAVSEAISLVCEYPELGTPVESGLRRVIVRGFPYSVIYDLQDGTAFIQAVAHVRRRPGYWHGRE
jgi:plasmid stabilization system protein ParE